MVWERRPSKAACACQAPRRKPWLCLADFLASGRRSASGRAGKNSWQMLLVPVLELFHDLVTQIPGKIFFDARQMGKILRLSVAFIEPRKNAKDFGCALRA